MMWDTHSHIYSEAFDADRNQMIQRAKEAGVEKILMPNIDTDSIERMLQVANDYPGFCIPMAGLHPTSVKDDYMLQLDKISTLFQSSQVCAVGEIGIDLYWDRTHLPQQIDSFEIQLQWAKDQGLPVVIHCRDAFKEVFALVEKHLDASLCGVFHSFTGDSEQAERICSYGNFKVGINGIVTFKNSGLLQALSKVEPRFVVVETDAPYLAPVPFRGKRNEPAYVRYMVEVLAGFYQLPIAEMNEQLKKNSKEVFKL